MDTLIQDLRYALRTMRRAPAFTLIAVLTLALGIGANTAIFSVIDAVLLRPLPYTHGEQLVQLSATARSAGATNVQFSAPDYQDFVAQSKTVSGFASAWPININLTGAGDPERAQAAVVSWNFFRVLGVAPVLGRDFQSNDDAGRIGYVGIISYRLWQRRFGGDPSVIGRTILSDEDPIKIIGVMPDGFAHPGESSMSPMDFWAPIAMNSTDPNLLGNRRGHVFDVFARIRPGVAVTAARAEMKAISQRIATQNPDVYPSQLGWSVDLMPLLERVVGPVRPALLVLLGAVGLVMLIGCANVANLLLARAASREREIAIRSALGAARSRMIRQLLVESVLLACIGGALGLALATWGTGLLTQLAQLFLPRAQNIGVSGKVLGFTMLLSLITGVGFGLVPALQLSNPDLNGVLKDAGRGATAGKRRHRTRAVLIVAEIATALVLLIGAGLLTQSFRQLLAVNPGFDASGVLTMKVWLPVPNDPTKGKYKSREARMTFVDRSLAALKALPGVESVGLIRQLPLSRQSLGTNLTIEGAPPALTPETTPRAEYRIVTPDYQRVMHVPLIRGRGLLESDDEKSPPVLLVNQAFAAKFFPGVDPVGRRVQRGPPTAPWLTIVGVVGDVRELSLEDAPAPGVYAPYRQNWGSNELSFVLRTSGNPDALVTSARQAVRSADPDQPLFNITSMREVMANATASRRFSTFLLMLFAIQALVLASVGIYGVMAYVTAQRVHEVGIRMALGATTWNVMSLVVGQGMRLAAIGLGIGLVSAWPLTRVLATQLYQVDARDPIIFGGLAMLLGSVAAVACYLPARRATRVDPVVALRNE